MTYCAALVIGLRGFMLRCGALRSVALRCVCVPVCLCLNLSFCILARSAFAFVLSDGYAYWALLICCCLFLYDVCIVCVAWYCCVVASCRDVVLLRCVAWRSSFVSVVMFILMW